MEKTIATLRVKLDKPFYDIAGKDIACVMYLSYLKALALEEIITSKRRKRNWRSGKKPIMERIQHMTRKRASSKKIVITRRPLYHSTTRPHILLCTARVLHLGRLTSAHVLRRNRHTGAHDSLEAFSIPSPSQEQKTCTLTGPISIGDTSNAVSFNQDAGAI